MAAKNGDQNAAAAKPRLSANARRLPNRPRVVMRSPRITTVDRLMTAPNRCTPIRVRHKAFRPRGGGASPFPASGWVTSRRNDTAASRLTSP
ncbi:MAG: hypothetical protein H6R24_567 [Proteobacteria bacterium]|nr:hypothetical protein [Pseudomonadota bacterium]